MLSAEGLRHAFGEGRGQVVALDGVSFNLTAGQTLAVFGPNGAGKTTLLKVLAGLIRPQQGSVRVAGGRRAIGWIGHQSHLYEHLTVRENLLFWAALYGVPAARRGPRADQVLERLGMGDRADQPVWSLSRGLAQRAAIAKAVIHDPRVLLLDEPFTGLDLAAAAELRALLGELRGGGASGGGRVLVLATHNVDEGVELATDVAFQRRGRFVHFAPRAGRGSSDIAEAYQPLLGQVDRESGIRGGGGSRRAAAVRAVLRCARGSRAGAAHRGYRARDTRVRRGGNAVQRPRHSHPLRRAAPRGDSPAVPRPAAHRRRAGHGQAARWASLERVGGVP